MENQMILATVVRILAALAIGGIIGSEREFHRRAAGVRTHMLVCLGACMTSLTGVFAYQVYGGGDLFRVAAQVVSGIGFLGAGMIILKNNNEIVGLTTAAGIWATATVGIALGYGYYAAALFGAVMIFLAVSVISKFEKGKQRGGVVFVEIADASKLNAVTEEITRRLPAASKIRAVAPKSSTPGGVGLLFEINETDDFLPESLTDIDGVLFSIYD